MGYIKIHGPARCVSILVVGTFSLECTILSSILKSLGHDVRSCRKVLDLPDPSALERQIVLIESRVLENAEADSPDARRQRMTLRQAAAYVLVVSFSRRCVDGSPSIPVDAHIDSPFRTEEIKKILDAVLERSEDTNSARGKAGASAPCGEDWSFAGYLDQASLVEASHRFKAELLGFVELRHKIGLKELAGRAHALISSARILGFPDLAKACQSFEQTVHRGEGYDQPFRDVLFQIALTREHIVGSMSDIHPPAFV